MQPLPRRLVCSPSTISCDLQRLRVAASSSLERCPRSAEVLAVEHLQVQVRARCSGSGTSERRAARGRAASRTGSRRRSAATGPRGRGRRGRGLAGARLRRAAACSRRIGLRERSSRSRRIMSWFARSRPSIASLRVDDEPAVLGRDPRRGELRSARRRRRGAGSVDARRRQVLRGHHHLLRALHQQAGEADRCPAGARCTACDQLLRRHLDAEVDDSKPLFERMISTRFLPMSWTSPLTVASTTLPARWRSRPSPCTARGGRPRPSSPRRSAAPRRR